MTEFPKFDLTGQVALVTGAARGLGRAISLALAHAGADVALGLRDINTGSDLVARNRSHGPPRASLANGRHRLDQISRVPSPPLRDFGKLDILVNNAGGGFTNLAIDVPEEEFDETLAINLKATFFAARLPRKS